MQSPRINVRLPREAFESLKATADSAGYSSPCQLARCVLVQFLDHCRRVRAERERYTGWIDEMVCESNDPRMRKDINERF